MTDSAVEVSARDRGRLGRRAFLRNLSSVGFGAPVAAALLLSACAPAAPSKPQAATAPAAPRVTTPLKVTLIDLTLLEGYPVVVAIERGYYAEEGLEVSYDLVNAPIGVRGLTSGQYDIATTSSVAPSAILAGAPLKVIWAPTQTNNWVLYLGKGVDSITDLKGKSVAVSSLGSTMDFLTQTVLEKNGVNVASSGVQLVAPGFTDDAKFAALESGAVAAAVLHGAGQAVAQKNGFKPGAAFDQYFKELTSSIAATDSSIQGKPQIVKAFVRGTVKGMRFLVDKPQDSYAIYERVSALPPDLATLVFQKSSKTLNRSGKAFPETVVENVEREKAVVAEHKVPDPAQHVNWQFVDEANRELDAAGWKP